MTEEQKPPAEPEPEPDDEDSPHWERLRGLVREELEAHETRRAKAAAEKPKDEKPAEPKTAEPAKEPEKPAHEHSSADTRPRRTAADVWFGRPRT